MNYFDSWSDTIIASLQQVWFTIINFLPELMGAIIILLLGALFGAFIGSLVANVIKRLKIDSLFSKVGLSKQLSKFGLKVSFSKIIGTLVHWFILLAVFMAIADILGWQQINEFLRTIIFYLPNVIIAVIILAFGFVIAELVQKMVIESAKSSEALKKNAKFLAALAKIAIVIFAVMAALIELGIAETLIERFFTAFVMSIALAAGLAFGLGGKDAAKSFIDRMTKND